MESRAIARAPRPTRMMGTAALLDLGLAGAGTRLISEPLAGTGASSAAALALGGGRIRIGRALARAAAARRLAASLAA
jgi:hypothetical protein